MSINLIDKLQLIYPFLCDSNEPEQAENERFTKYLAPLCYNHAIDVRNK